MTRGKAKKLRELIEKATASLNDNDALDGVELFPEWKSGLECDVGDRYRFVGLLYKCLSAHTTQETWTPTDAPSLWAKVLIPDINVIPEWEQPESTNPYMKGDRVKHDGHIWVSTIDNNVWAPGVYGWELSE